MDKVALKAKNEFVRAFVAKEGMEISFEGNNVNFGTFDDKP
jgi:hypothetical protein